MSEVKKIPELRFPEFGEPWIEKKIGSASSKVGSGSTPRGGETVYQKSGIPFIRSQNVNNGVLTLDETHIPDEVHRQMIGSKVLANDILLNITGASIGRSCVVPSEFEEGNVNQHVAIIRLKSDEPKFLQSFLSSFEGQKNILRSQTGSGREGLNFQSIRGFKVYFPTLPEQQKIASFLTAIDAKIEQLNQKKTLLEQYKKGVMQQVFSQQIRFKDYNGNAYPDWEEKQLGDVLDYEQPTKYLVSSTEYSDEFDIPVLTAGKTFLLGYTNETENVFTENLPVIIFDDFTTATQFVDFPFKAKSSAMKILVPKQGKNVKFIYEAMQLIRFEVGGHGRHWISQYSTFSISFPCPEEQAKIANFLSAIDAKIELVNNQLENNQQFKKGLLQKMFV